MWSLLLEIIARALFKALVATVLMLLVVGIAIGVYVLLSLYYNDYGGHLW